MRLDTIKEASRLPIPEQVVELNADEPVVVTLFNRKVAVMLSWETWQQILKQLEGK